MLFTDFLESQINELYAREQNKEYYVLPINIKNASDKESKIKEVLECLTLFLKKGNLKFSWRDKNYQFFKYFKYDKKQENEFIKRIVTSILFNLKIENFVKESISKRNIAYVFVVDNYKEFDAVAKEYKQRHVYIKFSFVIKPKDKKSHTVSSDNNVIIDLQNSYVDFISIHF